MKKTITLTALIITGFFCKAQTWTVFGPGANNDVRTLSVYSGTLYLGGSFTSVEGFTADYTASFNGATLSALGTGGSSFTGACNSITEFALSEYGAGSNVQVWNGSTWNTVSTWTGNNNVLYNYKETSLYVGGSFFTGGGAPSNNIAQYNGATWSAVGGGVNGTVYAITGYGTSIVVAGSFTMAGATAVNNIAIWNGSAWSAMSSGMNGTVMALCIFNGTDLAAGGSFTTAGGVTANDIAWWNGTAWTAFGTGITGGYVSAVAQYNMELFAGGKFTTAGGAAASNIAKVMVGSTAWLPLTSGTDDTVQSLCVSNGELLVGGAFAHAGGLSASHVAIWSEPSGINEVTTSHSSVNIYPNPSNGLITVKSEDLRGRNTIEVYNIVGEKVYNGQLTVDNERSTINLSSNAAGIYMYRIMADNGNVVSQGKLVIGR